MGEGSPGLVTVPLLHVLRGLQRLARLAELPGHAVDLAALARVGLAAVAGLRQRHGLVPRLRLVESL
eukprot:10896491-Alexandrium_andersonii.AAC.1